MSEKETSFVCIVCREAVSSFQGCPDNAVSFKSPGNYGSTVYDTIDGSHLEIIVCDKCLTKAGESGIVVESRVVQLTKRSLEKWNPDD